MNSESEQYLTSFTLAQIKSHDSFHNLNIHNKTTNNLSILNACDSEGKTYKNVDKNFSKSTKSLSNKLHSDDNDDIWTSHYYFNNKMTYDKKGKES